MSLRQLLLSSLLTVAVIAAGAWLLRPAPAPAMPAIVGGGPVSAAPVVGPVLERPEPEGDEGLVLRLPALDLAAPMREMALGPGEPIAVPDGPDLVAWYPDLGSHISAQAGTDTTASHGLLLGHVNWRDGSEGVFARLGELSAGDLVEVQDGPHTATYRVTAVDHVDVSSTLLTDVLDEGPRETVTLITCSGEYLWEIGGYSERTVVTAERLDVPTENRS